MTTPTNIRSHSDEETRPPVNPDCRELFTGFFKLGISAFGGAMPLAHRILIEERAWLTHDEFVDQLGLCQFLPGSNVANLAVALGGRFCGWRGALSALAGLVITPTVIVVALSTLYARYQNDPLAHRLFNGLACAAAGLLIQMAYKLLRPIIRRPRKIALAAACCVAIASLRLPLVMTLAIMVPISIAVSGRDGSGQ
jgi:chromate transporter